MSNKTFKAVKALVLRMSNLTNPSILSATQDTLPYGIMMVNPDDKAAGYWVLNSHNAPLGSKVAKVNEEDIVDAQDLDLTGMVADADGVIYLWSGGLTPWSSMARLEHYRNSLIKTFGIDRAEANRDRGLPYVPVIAGRGRAA